MDDLLLLGMKMVEYTSLTMTLEDCSTHCPASCPQSCALFTTELPLGLVKPVRAVAFSPGGTLLAAAGDSRVITLYDVSSGGQVANLLGHGAWIFSLDWSDTGEYLLSGYVCNYATSAEGF